MKGISLPINMIVIVALAIVVLLAVTVFFYSGFRPGDITDQQAWQNACGNYQLANDDCRTGTMSADQVAACTAVGAGTDSASCVTACCNMAIES